MQNGTNAMETINKQLWQIPIIYQAFLSIKLRSILLDDGNEARKHATDHFEKKGMSLKGIQFNSHPKPIT